MIESGIESDVAAGEVVVEGTVAAGARQRRHRRLSVFIVSQASRMRALTICGGERRKKEAEGVSMHSPPSAQSRFV